MELEGVKRGLHFLKKKNLTVKTLISDRHIQVDSYLAKEHKHIDHRIDIWHLNKGIYKYFRIPGFFHDFFFKALNCIEL